VKKTTLFIASALAVSGCAKSPFPVLDAKLGAFKGHPAQEVFDKFGSPGETQAAPKKTYVWSLPGYAGGAVGFQCVVKVSVDKDDKVADNDFSGNVAGCGHYAGLLDDSYHVAHGVFD
jgi:hypothetical protein